MKTTPHDEFFRAMFSNPGIAESYLRAFLPEEVGKEIDFSTLQILQDTFTDEQLRRSGADLLYTCQVGKKGHQLEMPILFEHKSHREPFIHAQILGYMIDIWRRCFREKRKLPIILPIVFYHGTAGWRYRPFSKSFRHYPEALRRYVPEVGFELHAIHDLPGAQIASLNSPDLRAMLHSFIAGTETDAALKNELLTLVLKDIDQDEPELSELQNLIFVYLSKSYRLAPNEFTERIELHMQSKRSPKFKSTYDQFIELGHKQGKEIGIQQGKEIGMEIGEKRGINQTIKRLLDKGMKPETVAEFLEYPLDEILALMK